MAVKRRDSHQRGQTDDDHSEPFRKVKALRIKALFSAHDRPLDLLAPFNRNRHLPRLHQQARAVRAEEEVAAEFAKLEPSTVEEWLLAERDERNTDKVGDGADWLRSSWGNVLGSAGNVDS